jgi:hypothetical protein
MQKLIYINDDGRRGGNCTDNINTYLDNGWKVVMISPISGAGSTHISTALVVIEKED